MRDKYNVGDIVRCQGAGFDGMIGYIHIIEESLIYPYDVIFSGVNIENKRRQVLDDQEITRVYYNNR